MPPNHTLGKKGKAEGEDETGRCRVGLVQIVGLEGKADWGSSRHS